MRVELIETVGKGRLRVSSPYGSFTAGWHGEEPPMGSVHFVEIEVNGEALWGQDLTVVAAPVQEIVDSGSSVRISGQIESLSPDGVLDLRLDQSLRSMQVRNLTLDTHRRQRQGLCT
jgi:hypothetical protein